MYIYIERELMFKFNKEQKSSISVFLFNTASYILTGSVLVEMYKGFSGVFSDSIPVALVGVICVALCVACGLLVIGDKAEKKKGGNK